MANELQYYGDPEAESGLTILARVYDSTGTQVGSDVSCAEVGILAIYQGDMPITSRGVYGVRFFNGSILLGQGAIEWNGASEITNTVIDTKINHLELSVFVDTEAVINGDGTEENPHNNFDDAKITADTLGSNTIIIEGDATVNVNLKNFNIKGGSSRATIDLNGQNVDGSRFEKITITGTAIEPANPKGFRATNCVLDGVTGLQGVYIDCLIKGTLTPADEAEINIDDCLSGIAGIGRPIINLTGLTNVKLSIRKYSGGLTLQNSTNAGNEVTVSSTEAKLTIDSGCNAGVISVRGVTQLTDESTGATIDTTGLIETVNVNSKLATILGLSA